MKKIILDSSEGGLWDVSSPLVSRMMYISVTVRQ